MKLNLSRKTWYVLLLIAAALGMANGFAMLFGQELAFLELFDFGGCGLAALFLAAEQDASPEDGPKLAKHASRMPNAFSGAYFGCFAAILVSYILLGSASGAVRLTIFWPLLAWIEYKRGEPVLQQLRLLIFIEIFHAAALIGINNGLSGFSVFSVVLWILACTARGWLAIILYKNAKNEADSNG